MRKIVLIAFAVACVSGCSTIINDKTQKVNVQTPNGTPVTGTVDGQTFTAPGIVTLSRENKDKVFQTDSPECRGTTVAEKSVDPVFFINILSGGVFGSTTDYSTEKMWKYSETIMLNCAKGK
jgi:hypothetical protein